MKFNPVDKQEKNIEPKPFSEIRKGNPLIIKRKHVIGYHLK